MTEENAKFNGEFIHVCLKIEIKAKIGEKKKQTRHLEAKISLNYTKFHNFKRENSLNSNSNHRGKCRIQW